MVEKLPHILRFSFQWSQTVFNEFYLKKMKPVQLKFFNFHELARIVTIYVKEYK